MRRIPDKFGNFITLDQKNEYAEIVLENKDGLSVVLGLLFARERTFVVNTDRCLVLKNNAHNVLFSAKFLTDAKTFDVVWIGELMISLEMLKYNLHIPFGIIKKTFAELIYLDISGMVNSYKDKFEAMLGMCDYYEEYFSSHPRNTPVDIEELVIFDPDAFIDTSLATVRNLASKKMGGEPYFVGLVRYYNYIKSYEN